jgi:NAD(P)-dependent dehydrogenase (short-subunit alcohol dehydrogenase family)
VWETTPNDWTWTFTVNVFGVAYGIQSFVPRMLAGGEPGYIINTSSGDGAIGPMPMASIYAASKSSVAIMTECLAAQLEDQETNLQASLFLPGGRGMLATGLWSSERNRPPELAREKPRPTKPQTIEGLVEQAKAAGREIPFQDLNELGRDVLEQIKTGVYCIQMNGNAPSAERLHERADRFGQGLNPTVPH